MNNAAQICPKIKNLRTIEARLEMQMSHHAITSKCGVSLQVFLQFETLSEQRRKSKLCRTCFYNSGEVYTRFFYKNQ